MKIRAGGTDGRHAAADQRRAAKRSPVGPRREPRRCPHGCSSSSLGGQCPQATLPTTTIAGKICRLHANSIAAGVRARLSVSASGATRALHPPRVGSPSDTSDRVPRLGARAKVFAGKREARHDARIRIESSGWQWRVPGLPIPCCRRDSSAFSPASRRGVGRSSARSCRSQRFSHESRNQEASTRVFVVFARWAEIAVMHPPRRVRGRVLHELGQVRDEGEGTPGGKVVTVFKPAHGQRRGGVPSSHGHMCMASGLRTTWRGRRIRGR